MDQESERDYGDIERIAALVCGTSNASIRQLSDVPKRQPFYDEAPIISSDGKVVGTLCVFDSKERSLNDAQREALKALARQAARLAESKVLKKKLVESGKLATLGEMAAGLAHEINNPLAIIQGRAGLLKEYASSGRLDSKMVVDAADRIVLLIQRIGKIIHGLRAFSRESDDEPMEQVDLGDLVSDMLAFCQEKIRTHGVELTVSIPDGVRADCRPVQITQVLLNLVSNAIDAVKDLNERKIMISAVASDQRIEISVSDSGNGIPAAIRNRIFEPFFTTKEIGKGTGLGLSISKGIMEGHRGTLCLDPDARRTRFVVKLPVSAARKSKSESAFSAEIAS